MYLPEAIFLTGPSSAGKTSIARELIRRLEVPYLYLSIDSYFQQYPVPIGPETVSQERFEMLVSGFHRATFGTVSAGNFSVVDLVLRKEHWWRECAELFKGHQTMIVQVRCSLEELERRERDRGDREIGMARWQCANMANSSLCDFEVDTTRLSTTEAVDAMLVHLSTQPRPTALGNYRRAEPR